MSQNIESLPVWRILAEIDHDALRHNAKVIRSFAGPDVGLIAVVKANGYGHGLANVVHTLSETADRFGVATLDEARNARCAAPSHDILILSPCLPDERVSVVSENFIPVVSSIEEAHSYARIAGAQPARIHVCIDTGMGRIGVDQQDAMEVVASISSIRGVQIDSVSTHLPVADSDDAFTSAELKSWSALVEQLRTIVPCCKFHALNSAASLERPQYAADFIRPGLALYGISPLPQFQKLLKPVMTLKTRVSLIRDVPASHGISYGRDFITPSPMRVATLAMGYADGYPRQTSGKNAQVLIRGIRCPILGRITMDQFMVDVSHLPENLSSGEEVVLFGEQNGATITVNEVAAWANTITWDILTRLGRRVIFHHKQ